MEEWKEYKLGDVCSRLSSGKNISASKISDSDVYPVFGGNGLRGYTDNSNFTGECAIIGRQGAFCGNVRFFSGEAYMTEHAVVVCGNEKANTRYLSYLLSTMNLGRLSGQSAQPGLAVGTLAKQLIKLPPLPTQQKIAAILSSLDDKIELNNKINTNLEQQAGALFKNWFVDFEPFGGKMPEGWKVGKLSEIGTIVGGSTPSKAKKDYYTNNGIAWITPKDLSNDKSKFISHGEIDITELGFKNSSAIKMPKGTVLYSSRAPIGYIAISKNEVTTNQGFKSVIPNPNVGNAYIYYFLRSNFELIDNMASGSTFKEISGTAMKNVPVLIPDDKTLFNFQTMCETLFSQQELLENENVTLSTIRDTLLSKLMNGEIEVGIK